MREISIEELKKLMRRGVVEFAYTKKDGSTRTAKGTLQSDYITTSFSSNGVGRVEHFGWCNYWDVEKGGWRKFKEENFLGLVESEDQGANEGMNRHELKDMIYGLYDLMDEKIGEMMSPGCADEETGRLRSQVYSIISKAADEIKEIGHSIH